MSNRVVDGHASICHWDLRFSFLTKDQCMEFINELSKTDLQINFSCSEELGMEGKERRFVIELHDMVWAHNLTIVAKILQTIDYNYDGN